MHGHAVQPIGWVLSIESDGSLNVQGLEAIDGTPVIDIKPVLGRLG